MRQHRPSAAILFLALLLGVPAAAKRPMTFDDLISFGRVSDPQVSPDGRSVVYVVDRYDKAANTRQSSLWLASLPEGENRQLTRSDKRDRAPRWSPDGQRLAFLSNRSGTWQIWTIRLDGGEATQIAKLPVDVTDLRWSPDGRWLLFTADVFPDCPDLACTEKRNAEREKSKVQARVYDRLMVRHWDQWSDGTRSHVFVMPADGSGAPLDLTPGDASCPPFLGGSDEFDVSPDSQELAFARNTDKDEALSTNSDVWLVPLGGGEPRRITSSPAWDGSPRYSPDGRYLAYRAMARAGFEADRTTLVLYERASGAARELTAAFENNVDDFVWAPDSAGIYFSAVVEGESRPYEVGLADGKLREVVRSANNSNLRLAPDGATLVFTRDAVHRPAEVFVAKTSTGDAFQLSHINDDRLQDLDLPEAESFTVKGAGGATVQSWLVRPPGFDPAKKYPVVVLVHGGPQSTWLNGFHYRWNPALFAAPGYVVVMPNPRGSPGWGQQFVDEITADWGGKVFGDLMKVVDHVETLSFVDRTRICAAGGSYGGYMANWMLGHTERFRCLVSHAGVYNTTSMYGATEELWFVEWEFRGTPWTNPRLYDRWSPHLSAPKFKTPTLVIHGARDYRVPFEQGLELFTALQRRGVPSRLLYFPDEGHWVLKPQNSELWYQTVHDWLARYLKP